MVDVVHARCAGIDISKRDAKVCVRVRGSGSRRTSEEVTTWGSMTKDVHELREYLVSQKVTCVVMEATGTYWKQFYYLLEPLTEQGVEVMLVNARAAKNLPGRKTDVKDAVWLADLAAHGLLSASFVPPAPIRALRDLTRARTTLTRDLSREVSRLEDTLEDTGIKLSAVVSDINGVSGRAMLGALVAGERDPERLADLGDRRLKASRQQLVDALTGRFTDHHAFMVGLHTDRIEEIGVMIAKLDQRIEEAMSPFREHAALLTTIPGVSTRAAQVVIAETGGDMSVFTTPGHLVSWAGLAPGHHQSARRTRSVRARPGNTHLRGALGTSVMSIAHANNTRLAARYRRIAARRGPLRANVAVQNTILTAVWHMLTTNQPYTDLGTDFYTNRNRDRSIKKAIKTLEADGYTVIPTAA